MKKLFLIITIALASFSAQSQSYQLLNNHSLGNYNVGFSNLTELRNRNVVASMYLVNRYPNGIYPLHSLYGYCLLNVSHDEAQVVDSVIILDNYDKISAQLLEPNPNGEDYIFARINSDLNGDNLCINRLNENLTPIAAEVTVPLEENVGYCSYFCMGNNDIVMANIVPDLNGTVFSRYSLDGMLKNRVFYHDSICPFDTYLGGKMKVWNEERTEYSVYGRTGQYHDRFSYLLLDSTFNIIDSATIRPNPTGIHYVSSQDNDIENLDEETFLVATHFNGIHDGILVSKRDKAAQVDLKKLSFIKSGPASQDIIGLCKSCNGDYYLAYIETDLKVVRFDSDLNIVWNRVYYIIDTPYSFHYQLRALNDGGLAIGGVLRSDTWDDELFVIIINDDGSANTPEAEALIRPYGFYPNPAQDRLTLQYSPDVKPVRIELFDLQGRLVRTQSQGLESMDLQGLTVGQYLMKVTLEDGKTYTDKVVKK